MKERSAVELFRACTADCTSRGRDNRAWGEFVLRFQPLLRASVARVLRRLDQRASPETIDDLGFFAEHQIPLPTPDCGENVCIHGMLGVMGNMISGSNCTVVMVGMNTPIDADELERPPLNLTITVDLSGSMQGEPLNRVREGLLRMRDELQPGDRVSLVGFGDDAQVIVEELACNVMDHADGAGELAMALHVADGRIVLEIRDDGAAYDLLAHPSPDLDADIDQRPIGGLGIHLVRELSQDAQYRRQDGWNVLRVVLDAILPHTRA